MKKIIIVLAMCNLFLSIGLAQQDSILLSKKGKPVLPQKRDFAIGISANPLFNYAGNLFNLQGTNQFGLGLLDNGAIFGKYFISANKAIRLKLFVNQGSEILTNSIPSNETYIEKVTDKMNRSFTNFGITVGYEKRKGISRLQFDYGAEFIFNILGEKYKYTYGNSFSNTYPYPISTVNFYGGDYNNTSSRPIENIFNNQYGLGIRGFLGIEYFFLPKISIGGEMGLGFIETIKGKIKNTSEHWDYIDSKVVTDNKEYKRGNSYQISSDILNGQVFLLFHFN